MPNISAIQRVGEDKYLFNSREYVSNAVGLAYISASDELKSVMELGNHTKVSEIVPLLIDKSAGGLQTINGENCSNSIKNKGKTEEISLEKLNKKLTKNFPEMKLSVLRIVSENSWF